ncbi:hypothetical protein V6N12_046397 [Hibiscus sabdariffa]|uniref:Uncharacterized protein n=1 Tax=Hibiscus sabdariffa TaxID=183260 RepID=A0ABR2DII6_9ROSI
MTSAENTLASLASDPRPSSPQEHLGQLLISTIGTLLLEAHLEHYLEGNIPLHIQLPPLHQDEDRSHIILLQLKGRLLAVDLDTVCVKGLPSSSRGPGRLSGEMSPMLHSSDEEGFYISDSPEILPEGAIFTDD